MKKEPTRPVKNVSKHIQFPYQLSLKNFDSIVVDLFSFFSVSVPLFAILSFRLVYMTRTNMKLQSSASGTFTNSLKSNGGRGPSKDTSAFAFNENVRVAGNFSAWGNSLMFKQIVF